MSAAPDFSAGAAWIEGRFVPIAEVRIPILDRGFTRSDATYDVTHVWKGYVFRLEDHLDRFERNIAALRLELPCSREELRRILIECVRITGLKDAFLQMTLTRGLTPRGSRDPRQAENRLYVFAVPFVWIADREKQEQGLNLHISGIERIPSTSLDPRTKNFHWLDLTLGLFEAYDAGCDIEVLSDRGGNVTEGPGFNIFVLAGGRLLTPREGVFDGMTRRTVLELAGETNVRAEETIVPADLVRRAEEVFLTSTAGGIMPVTAIDGEKVGDGRPGPLTRRLQELYWSKKEKGWLGTAIDYRATAAA
jgi:branched-chain amino acid aminotransferase